MAFSNASEELGLDRFSWVPVDIRESLGHLHETRQFLNELQLTGKTEGGKLIGGNNDTAVRLLKNYLVIRSCGHVETTLRSSIRESAQKHSDPAFANLIEKYILRSGENPRSENVARKLKALNEEFASNWKDFLSDSHEYRDEVYGAETIDTYGCSLQYLVEQRNMVAHGEEVTLSETDAVRLSVAAEHIAVHIVSIFDCFFRIEDRSDCYIVI